MKARRSDGTVQLNCSSTDSPNKESEAVSIAPSRYRGICNLRPDPSVAVNKKFGHWGLWSR